jgi:hypothetical protein
MLILSRSPRERDPDRPTFNLLPVVLTDKVTGGAVARYYNPIVSDFIAWKTFSSYYCLRFCTKVIVGAMESEVTNLKLWWGAH